MLLMMKGFKRKQIKLKTTFLRGERLEEIKWVSH